jgi:hypothetical protein
MAENQNTSNYDNPFWLQILGDQMRFISCALMPRETNLVQQAEHFITLFDTLYAQSTEYLPEIALERFLDTAYNVTQQARTFCLTILRRQISGDACINLSPGFLNQMANEAEEYLRILDLTMKKRQNLMHPIHYHLLWLANCSVNVDTINSCLDPSERELLRFCHRFMHKFDGLYFKSMEMMGFLRTGLTEFSALYRLNSDVINELVGYAEFLLELENKLENKEILGTISRLSINHMYRKACYYAMKLSEVSGTQPPVFDIMQKRRE